MSNQFISYLVNHHPSDECIGLLNIIATIIDAYDISDIHLIESAIIFKVNQIVKYNLTLNQNTMKKLRYYVKLHAHMDPSNTQHLKMVP